MYVGLVSLRFGFLSAVSTFCDPFNLLIRFGLRKNCLKIGRSLSFYVFIKRVIVIIEAYYCCQLHRNFYQTSAVKVNSVRR